MNDKVAKAVGTFVLALAATAVGVIVFTFPVKWLINYMFTPTFLLAVFGVAKFTFWRAYSLMFLCNLLFKFTVSSK
jgi:hypothetical protein